HSRAEVLRDHVGAVDELERDLPALGRLQVEREAALVAVGAQMQHAVPVVPDVAAAPMPLPRALGRLHRDHVGAEVGERLDAHRPKQKVVETDDANSLQEIEHVASATLGAYYARGAGCTANGGFDSLS